MTNAHDRIRALRELHLFGQLRKPNAANLSPSQRRVFATSEAWRALVVDEDDDFLLNEPDLFFDEAGEPMFWQEAA